jgi:hypothetical protein
VSQAFHTRYNMVSYFCLWQEALRQHGPRMPDLFIYLFYICDSNGFVRVHFRRFSPPSLVFRQRSRTPRRSAGLVGTLSTILLLRAPVGGRRVPAWTSEAGSTVTVTVFFSFRRFSPPSLVFRHRSRTPMRSIGLVGTLSTLLTTVSTP